MINITFQITIGDQLPAFIAAECVTPDTRGILNRRNVRIDLKQRTQRSLCEKPSKYLQSPFLSYPHCLTLVTVSVPGNYAAIPVQNVIKNPLGPPARVRQTHSRKTVEIALNKERGAPKKKPEISGKYFNRYLFNGYIAEQEACYSKAKTCTLITQNSKCKFSGKDFELEKAKKGSFR